MLIGPQPRNKSEVSLAWLNFTERRWEDIHEKAFSSLKNALVQAPVLKLPNFSQVFILQTDASDKGIGAILLQDEGNIRLPVSYASRKLKASERNYSTIEKECLAILLAISTFERYLYGKQFILETDHQPLIYLQKFKIANARLMRWSLLLQPYRFRIVAIKEKDNVGAEFLSRKKDREVNESKNTFSNWEDSIRSELKRPSEAAGVPSSVARCAGGVTVNSQQPFRVGWASDTNPKFIRSKTRDICYKYGLYGHWAKECKNGGNRNFTAPRESSAYKIFEHFTDFVGNAIQDLLDANLIREESNAPFVVNPLTVSISQSEKVANLIDLAGIILDELHRVKIRLLAKSCGSIREILFWRQTIVSLKPVAILLENSDFKVLTVIKCINHLVTYKAVGTLVVPKWSSSALSLFY
ncbi:Retrovirus-related Pol polyprotein from transposon 297,Retrovirus-related Pol polyprotein from transposon 17.6 [Mytilus coruscus]|uniref:Retrovirus-related Pol polyprotein from transposon 297,Retrovirus-related Pol polyprotein from transposon 17.6 n=1 Tax=Mytilus coruscus TaxID=42192 RepID=A0A6J8BHN2_MYTCO|nr:Retrovirus-related Pol polyprotein from transposon 297,Retrovirus-related Pol polyprotein from transposon 17.6 [Mytilus coruscus]